MKKLSKNISLIYVIVLAMMLPVAAWAQKAEVDRTELPVKGP